MTPQGFCSRCTPLYPAVPRCFLATGYKNYPVAVGALYSCTPQGPQKIKYSPHSEAGERYIALCNFICRHAYMRGVCFFAGVCGVQPLKLLRNVVVVGSVLFPLRKTQRGTTGYKKPRLLTCGVHTSKTMAGPNQNNPTIYYIMIGVLIGSNPSLRDSYAARFRGLWQACQMTRNQGYGTASGKRPGIHQEPATGPPVFAGTKGKGGGLVSGRPGNCPTVNVLARWNSLPTTGRMPVQRTAAGGRVGEPVGWSATAALATNQRESPDSRAGVPGAGLHQHDRPRC